MFILKESKGTKLLKEYGTAYSEASPKEAWGKITAWARKTKTFKANLAFTTMDISSVEGFYNKVKIEGAKIVFSDTRIPGNALSLYFRDISSTEYGEDTDARYESLRLYLRSKQFVLIVPWN